MAGVTKAGALRQIARVLASEVQDRRRPPPAPSEQRSPLSPTGITPQWLTRVLCPPSARVSSVRVLTSSQGTTTRQTLALTYDQDGSTPRGEVAPHLPSRVFVKFTHALAQRLMLGLGGLVESEPRFYAHVRPTLRIETPRCYFGSADARSWRSVLVLEDVVHTRGAEFWRPGHRVSREQVEDLLAAVAGWHGRLWEGPRLAGWRWLRTPADLMGVIDSLLGLADRTAAGQRRAAHLIPPRLSRLGRDLRPALRRSMELASQGPQTYLHGDLHVANTYRTEDGRAGVCDWQVSLRGSWAHDFGYLMATALETPDRRAWERELLEFYLEQLAAAGGALIPLDRAWLAYRQATLYPYFAWLYTIGRSRLQPHFQPDGVSLTLIGRIAAAIEDLESLAALGR